MTLFGLPAYVGPGAGFAFLGSLLSLITAVVAGIVSIAVWPFRTAWLLLMRPRRSGVRKAIFLGFDGLDPVLTEKLMADGKLPNLALLRDRGSYRRLRTTFPAVSPVAWSTFATGVNPAKHNIFDSVARDLSNYSSTAEIRRKGESFWKILGRHAVRSTILLIPGSYPPEAFNGRELSEPLTGDHDRRISYPSFYASYLAKLLGEDYLTRKHCEAIFFSALDKTRRGVVACVFPFIFNENADAVDAVYLEMDRIVGQTLAVADLETAVFVLSDRGRCACRREVNLNAWLLREGYLVLEPGRAESGEHFEGVDWAHTRAYALGSSGVYLNLRGREGQGIVKLEDAAGLKKELVAKLAVLVDQETNEPVVRAACQASDVYHGPYLNAAPDILIGYAADYRASPDAAHGKVTATILDDNRYAGRGDDCVDPDLVPGILFSNLKMISENPGIEDMAPTALGLFGVPAPAWMEGRSVVAAA